jgi:hypothetical protein
MHLTQLSVVIIALGVALALAVLVWRGRVRRLNSENPAERCRRDIQAMRRGREIRVTERRSGDVWSARAESDPAQSRAKKATAWVALGSTGGCGGCGGCGCGG